MAGKPVLMLLCFAVVAHGFRTPSKAHGNINVSMELEQKIAEVLPGGKSFRTIGEKGLVDYMFTMGAPGGASPGLRHQQHGGCFNGLRVYTTRPGLWFGTYADVVPRITEAFGLRHAWTSDLMQLDIGRGDDGPTAIETSCVPTDQEEEEEDNSEISRRPYTGTVSQALHRSRPYIDNMALLNSTTPWLMNATHMAMNYSYLRNVTVVEEVIKTHDWHIAGWARHPGNAIGQGDQISYLFQREETFECMLTFQGTDSLQGWVTNFKYAAVHFCGLVGKEEFCTGVNNECKVEHPLGAFAHMGFKDRLKVLAMTEEWNTTILPRLPHCSKVSILGHSNGGAMAELFNACRTKALAPGDYGYEDYALFDWNWSEPMLMRPGHEEVEEAEQKFEKRLKSMGRNLSSEGWWSW